MYDAGGNITQKCEYAYTTGNLVNATALDTIAYGYTDVNWPDLLTSYDGQDISGIITRRCCLTRVWKSRLS